jgi:hypothetical protein
VIFRILISQPPQCIALFTYILGDNEELGHSFLLAQLPWSQTFNTEQKLTKVTEVAHVDINNMEKDIHVDDGLGERQAVIATTPV